MLSSCFVHSLLTGSNLNTKFEAQFDEPGQIRLRCVKRLELGQIVSPETAKEAARKVIFDQNPASTLHLIRQSHILS